MLFHRGTCEDTTLTFPGFLYVNSLLFVKGLYPSNTADLFRTLVPSVSKETPKYEKNVIEPRKNIITNIVIINFIGILAKSIYNKIRIKLNFSPII